MYIIIMVKINKTSASLKNKSIFLFSNVSWMSLFNLEFGSVRTWISCVVGFGYSVLKSPFGLQISPSSAHLSLAFFLYSLKIYVLKKPGSWSYRLSCFLELSDFIPMGFTIAFPSWLKKFSGMGCRFPLNVAGLYQKGSCRRDKYLVMPHCHTSRRR